MSDDQAPSVTPRCRKLLESAARLAREMDHAHVGAEHLLLAMVKDRDAVPTQVLAGITNLDRVEARLREVMASDSYAGEPPARAEWLLACELPALLPALARCVPPGVKYGVNVVGDRAWVIVDKPGDTQATLAAARALLDGGH
jgi:Clp amino terminal domain, pathogenicity island component